MKKRITSVIIVCLTYLTPFSQSLPLFHVKAVQLITIDDNDRQKILRALDVFEKIMNDTAFQKKLLDTTFLFDLPNDPMKNLTTKQIVDTLYSGREWYHKTSDNIADIEWECNQRVHKPPFTTALGYGLPNDSVIHTYIFFVRKHTFAELVNNLAHEWSHKIGFDHQLDYHNDRDKTVPYLFGNLVAKYVDKYAK